MLVHYWVLEVAQLWKSISGEIQDGSHCLNWTYWNNNCRLHENFVQSNHMTADTLQMLKVTGSKVKVAAWCNISALQVVGIVVLSVECRTCDQEVVGLTLGQACGVKSLGKFLTPMCLCSPSSISCYRPKGGDALQLGSKGRYGSCVGGR